MAVIEKQKSKRRPDSAGAQEKKKKKPHVGVSLSHPLFKCSLEKVCQTRSGVFETCL